MKHHFIFFMSFFTLLFLFYPGDSYFFHLFAYNRRLFEQKKEQISLKTNPVPVVKNTLLPEISAEGIYVVDLPSFTPLLKRNERTRFFPASTTKIITALVVRDIYKPDDIITVKETTSEGQIMNLVYGEKISIENLLYGLLVHSANDAAYALANDYGYDIFVRKMNEKAQELHMAESFFTNPAGFDDIMQVTSPFDLALAARQLLKDPYLAKVVGTKEIIISDVNYTYFHKLTNVNSLLGEIRGLGGLKTGYTEYAGENLVSFYKKDGYQYIVVVMKSLDRFTDTKNMVKWIDENVSYIPMPSYATSLSK